MSGTKHLLRWGVVFLILTAVHAPLSGQQFTGSERAMVESMLEDIHHDLKVNYYDPTFHGVDIDARFRAAKDLLQKATSLNQALGVIAWFLDPLNDSHTFFVPPPRPYRMEYGWKMQMVGDRCLITAVKPGSDAATKGLRPGDTILAINGFPPTRDNLWKLDYLFNMLRPQPSLQLHLRAPDGKERQVEVMPKVLQMKRLLDFTGESGSEDIWNEIRNFQSEIALWHPRQVEFGEDLLIWKLPMFDQTEQAIDAQAEKARKHKALILDLRGNPGGEEDTLERVVSNLFDHDVKVAEVKGRRKTEPMKAKSRGAQAFTGTLIVLVDSQSASAAEILARLVQLEHRGRVLGDTTMGAVMQAKFFSYKLGLDRAVFFGALITDADVIMGDGKSLEHSGVTPDEILLPTPDDLAQQRDPVLAYAAGLMGVKLTPEDAGKLFPIEWRKD